MFNVGFWMGRRPEGAEGKGRLQSSLRDRSPWRSTDTESARRVAMATKWGMMEEDVLPAADRSRQRGGGARRGRGEAGCNQVSERRNFCTSSWLPRKWK